MAVTLSQQGTHDDSPQEECAKTLAAAVAMADMVEGVSLYF